MSKISLKPPNDQNVLKNLKNDNITPNTFKMTKKKKKTQNLSNAQITLKTSRMTKIPSKPLK